MATLAPALLLSLVAVSALVASDFHDIKAGRFICKPLAAAAFLWLALLSGATGSNYGNYLLAGLLLCAAGDVLLMFDAEKAFLAGLVAFLCGHLLYAVAFVQLPINLTGITVSTLPALLLISITLMWLKPHLHDAMRLAVPCYMLVIAAMLVFAGGTWGQTGSTVVIVGAWGFAMSDLAVARRQFICADRINGVWGTPLYFGSQMLLAASAGLVAT